MIIDTTRDLKNYASNEWVSATQ